MFDRNKKHKRNSNSKESVTTKNDKHSKLAAVNMVSEGTEIIGKLITQSDIRIAGSVDGEAQVDGKVIIASTGHVEGDVNATDADIAGRVEGEVHTENKLTLRQSAVVECDIYTQSLVVEGGATFNGECHMRDYNSSANNGKVAATDSEIKPQKEALPTDGN
ncbi:MAG TPA: polymer-forming cytoskeletal protein [Balneolaceae bacterium]|nr:polymer-forming cytoskeletal protein [Balneolaceae bacterium]